MSTVPLLRRSAAAAVLLTAFALASPVAAQDKPPAAPAKVASMGGVTEYRLGNGFRVLLYPDPSTPKVTVISTVFVGSRHEGYGETGMAHLLEHMNFKSTPTHKGIKKLLTDRGASYGGTTSMDQTWYDETLPGTDDNLEFAVRLEADRLVNSLIDREELASEMTVVRNEFELNENSPMTILTQRVLGAAYEWHNYGKVPVGNRGDIERVQAEPLRAFYRKHYRPDNAMLVVAGKFDEKKALEHVVRHFGPLKNPAGALDRPRTEEPAQDGERSVTLRRVGMTGTVLAAYHIPSAAHADFAPLAVLARVLRAEPQGRLHKTLVAGKKSSEVQADAWAMHDPGLLFVSAQVNRDQSPDEVRKLLLDAVEAPGAENVTADEVRDARAGLTSGWHLSTSRALAEDLRQWAGCGDWRLLFLHRDRLAKVTPEDVNRVAAKYLVRNNRTVGTYVPTDRPERAAVPATQYLAAMLKDFKGVQTFAAGEEFDPTAENIVKRLQLKTLPSGIKAALLPRKTRGEVVQLQLALRYGNERSLAGLVDAGDFLPTMMLAGTRGHDLQALERALTKLDGASIDATGEIGAIYFTVQCKRERLAEVVKLLGEILREPAFHKDEFEKRKRAAVEGLRARLKEPDSLAAQALRRKLHPLAKDDLRYSPTLEESIARYEGVTLEQVRKLYAEQLGGKTGELAVVGDFDPEAAVRQVDAVLEGWKTATPYRRIARSIDTRVGGSSEVIDTPDKENAVYCAGHGLALRRTDPDHPALTVGASILGRPMTSSRLWERLREKDGLSYHAEATYSADDRDPVAALGFVAICNPANMPKVRQAMREEIEKILATGVTRAELDAAKKAILTTRRTFTDAEILDKLVDDLSGGDGFAAYVERSRRIGELTVEQVNAALRKHLQPKKLTVVEAGDFRTKGAPDR